ncbi:MAG: 3-deoxy-D-manno-octulosonic acid transferase [Proteobacteria bacterium SG_bin9]|nr:MAG: 3-deoxy-D-manno-octulosonic acid transferase [Proteobacteria bacterium SG_bin9]
MSSDLPLTLRAYRKLSAAAVPFSAALIRRRLKQGKEDPARFNERRGVTSATRPPGPLIWIHGASVGEVLAAAALVDRLRALNIRILMTSGTVTSAEIITGRFPPDVLHQYLPYDAPRYVDRFLDTWQPTMALFVESDLWPNLILSCSERRIPMVVVNGRMSQRSYPRWRKAQATIGALLGRLDFVLAQSDADAERFSSLGARDVMTTGNLKLDVPAPPADRTKLDRLMAVTRGRPVIAAASTHAGEEELVVAAHRKLAAYLPALVSVIIPRHPKRGSEIAGMVANAGLQVALRSREQLPSAQTDVYVADTIGEMGVFYRFAPIVFMGGSLVEHGGQNPIEAIKLGAAILHGPHVHNFTEVYGALDRTGGARQVDSVEMLVRQFGQWLSDSALRQQSSDAAMAVVDRLGGALERTLAALEPYLLQLRLEAGAGDA